MGVRRFFKDPLLFSSIALFSGTNLAISVRVASDMAGGLVDLGILVSVAVASELGKICAMSYSYSLFRERDYRAGLAVLVVLITSAISITTVAGFFSNKYADQLEGDKYVRQMEEGDKDRIFLVRSKIEEKEIALKDLSSTIVSMQRNNYVTKSLPYVEESKVLRKEVKELRLVLEGLLRDREKSRGLVAVQTLAVPLDEGVTLGTRDRSGPQSIRLPSFLAGNDSLFFLFGLFIDVTLLCLIVLSNMRVVSVKVDKGMDKDIVVIEGGKGLPKGLESNIYNKKSKPELISEYVIGLGVGDTVSMNKLKKEFSCSYRLIKPVMEELCRDGFLCVKGNRYVRKSPLRAVK